MTDSQPLMFPLAAPFPKGQSKGNNLWAVPEDGGVFFSEILQLLLGAGRSVQPPILPDTAVPVLSDIVAHPVGGDVVTPAPVSLNPAPSSALEFPTITQSSPDLLATPVDADETDPNALTRPSTARVDSDVAVIRLDKVVLPTEIQADTVDVSVSAPKQSQVFQVPVSDSPDPQKPVPSTKSGDAHQIHALGPLLDVALIVDSTGLTPPVADDPEAAALLLPGAVPEVSDGDRGGTANQFPDVQHRSDLKTQESFGEKQIPSPSDFASSTGSAGAEDRGVTKHPALRTAQEAILPRPDAPIVQPQPNDVTKLVLPSLASEDVTVAARPEMAISPEVMPARPQMSSADVERSMPSPEHVSLFEAVGSVQTKRRAEDEMGTARERGQAKPAIRPVLHEVDRPAVEIERAAQAPGRTIETPSEFNRPEVAVRFAPVPVGLVMPTSAVQSAIPDRQHFTVLTEQTQPARFVPDTPQAPHIPGQVTVRVEPPELGHIRIDLGLSAQGVVGRMRFDSEGARLLAESDLPALHKSLADSGVRVDRLEFVSTLSSREPIPFRWDGQSWTNTERHNAATSAFAGFADRRQTADQQPKKRHQGLWEDAEFMKPFSGWNSAATAVNLVA